MDPPTTPEPKTNYEKGEHYLQLSLETLEELSSLSKNESLSESQRAAFEKAYRASKVLSEETKKIRNKLLPPKKSFHKFLINLFIRESRGKRFYKVAYENYSSIRRTSDDLNRTLVSEIGALLASGHLRVTAQGNEAVNEENLRNAVEDNPGRRENSLLDEEDGSTRSPRDIVEAEGFSSNENTQDIHLDLHTNQDQEEVIAILDGLGIKFNDDDDDDGGGGDDDDDGGTIKPLHSQSRAPSPRPSLCTINIYINKSVVSFDSESTGATLNVGENEGVGFGY